MNWKAVAEKYLFAFGSACSGVNTKIGRIAAPAAAAAFSAVLSAKRRPRVNRKTATGAGAATDIAASARAFCSRLPC